MESSWFQNIQAKLADSIINIHLFIVFSVFCFFVTPRYDIFLNFSVRFPFYRYLYQKNVGLAGRHPAPAAFIRHRHRCGRKNTRAAADLPQSGIPPAVFIPHFEAITK